MPIEKQKMGRCINKVLPAAYDNTLSYYEVLAKVCNKLNELINVVNAIVEEIENNE